MRPAREIMVHALSLRGAQDMEGAWTAISDAAKLAPKDPHIAFAHAQFAFETWRPAARMFRDAQRMDPDNLAITRNAAAALAAEGEGVAAEKLLERSLHIHPDWIDGHKALSTLRITSRDNTEADRSFAAACAELPDNLPLRMAWFHNASAARDWAKARKIIDDGISLFGEKRALIVAHIYIASESGDAAADDTLFDPVGDMNDPGLDLCRVRHALRAGKPEKAIAIALPYTHTPSASIFWPYLSLAWRILGDDRAAWLDGDPLYIQSYDLDFSPTKLNELADILRQLHTMQAPYPEQSVRGGTQTDRQLFFHHSPVIQNAKARFLKVVQLYIDDLPAPVADHPLLSPARNPALFEGSWSVRLNAQGFHSCHTHSRGWISSAFYAALPSISDIGAPPAGWINFGTPPPELGLDLSAYKCIEPKPGRLVLFPSTMWHGTIPFVDGERLTMAFDIRSPQ
jgi:Tfp pilus assembly protein PilF